MKRSALILLLLAPFLTAEEKPAPVELAAAADAFLESLDETKAKRATIAFDDAERTNWHYTPRQRKGLALKAMTESQKNAAVALVNTILSEKGAMKTARVITAEALLGVMEKRPEFRDPERYFVAIFGAPGDPEGWGMRFEGHHVSINVTVLGKKVSVTPSFLGSNPAEIREGEHKGLRPLAAEEDLGRALAAALLESGKKEVRFSEKAITEILTREEPAVKPLEAVGIAARDMSEAQRGALMELVSEYTGRYRADVAEADMKKIREAGIEAVHFGWAGSLERGEAFYYRIQGPTFLMECANTQNDANHIHAVWRDFNGDFGRDLLREHFEGHDHP